MPGVDQVLMIGRRVRRLRKTLSSPQSTVAAQTQDSTASSGRWALRATA